MLRLLILIPLSLINAVAQVQAQDVPEEQLKPSLQYDTFSSQDVTYSIYISPTTTYAVGGAKDVTITPQPIKQDQLHTDETFFSATDAAGSVTVLPGSIVPSDILSSLLGSSLPTVLVTATDPSPTPSLEGWTLLSTAWGSSSTTTVLPLTWTITQNGTTKTVVPTTTDVHQSSQTASAGSSMRLPLVRFGGFSWLLILCTVTGTMVRW